MHTVTICSRIPNPHALCLLPLHGVERDIHQIYFILLWLRALCERLSLSLVLLLAAQIPCNKLNGTRCDETKHYTLSTLCIERVCVYFLFYNVVYPKHKLSSRALLLYVCSVCYGCATPRARSYIRAEPTHTNFHPTPHTSTHCVFFAIAPALSLSHHRRAHILLIVLYLSACHTRSRPKHTQRAT